MVRRRCDQARPSGQARHRPDRPLWRRRPRDPRRSGSGQDGQLRHHRRRRQPAIARYQRQSRLGPVRGGRPRTGDPHPGRRRHRRQAGQYHHRAAIRPLRQAGKPGPGHRHLSGAAVVLDLQQQAGRHLRRVSRQGRVRGFGSRGDASGAGRDPHPTPRGADRPGGRHRQLHRRQLPRRHRHAAGRRAAGGAGGAAVHPQLAGDADHRRGAAAVGGADVLGDGHAGVLAEPGQLPGDHAGHRHPGRRRHRRDREHLAPHQDGQDALPRRHRRRGRDRAGG